MVCQPHSRDLVPSVFKWLGLGPAGPAAFATTTIPGERNKNGQSQVYVRWVAPRIFGVGTRVGTVLSPTQSLQVGPKIGRSQVSRNRLLKGAGRKGLDSTAVRETEKAYPLVCPRSENPGTQNGPSGTDFVGPRTEQPCNPESVFWDPPSVRELETFMQ